MDFTAVLEALNKASGFELYRLRAAIDRVLADPKWVQAIKQTLRPGQEVVYFDPRSNRQFTGKLIEFRTKGVVVHHRESGEHWLIPYAAINLDGADVHIRNTTQQGLSRHEVTVGDRVGFLDHDQQQRSGRIVRLNDKTVTLDSQGQKWRVAYALLHRVVDPVPERIIITDNTDS